MEIWAEIERDGPGVVQFNSGKVLARIRDTFPSFISDYHDRQQAEFEFFLQHLKDTAVPEPTRTVVEQQMRGKTLRNGPTYAFVIELGDGVQVTGTTRRLSTNFKSKELLDDNAQAQLIRFLLALEVGEILSDTQTRFFSVPCQRYPGADYWQLDPNLLLD